MRRAYPLKVLANPGDVAFAMKTLPWPVLSTLKEVFGDTTGPSAVIDPVEATVKLLRVWAGTL